MFCAVSVQPRNQIKNQRENSWRATFPDNHGKIQTRFQTCMAPGLSHGRAGLLVLLSVSTCLTTSQHSTNQAKTQESLKQIFSVRTKKTVHRLRHNDKNKLVQGDPLNFSPLNEEMNGEECTR